MSQIRAAKRQRFSGRMLAANVGVGAEANSFDVHEPVLRQSSKFFDAMMSRERKEENTRTINLPDDVRERFEIYVDWLYSGQLVSISLDAANLNEHTDTEKLELTHLYCFGEKLQDNNICNATLRALAEIIDWSKEPDGHFYFLNYVLIRTIYSGTPGGSPARRFIVDIFVENAAEDWFDAQYGERPSEFHNDFALALVKQKNRITDYKFDGNLSSRCEQWFKKD